jgi:hypothetical protein
LGWSAVGVKALSSSSLGISAIEGSDRPGPDPAATPLPRR